MRILVTGSKGFIGKNLIADLRATTDYEIFAYDKDSDPKLLDYYTRDADFIFHLAGVNRPENDSEFMEGNFGFTSLLLDKLKENKNTSPIMLSSSIQAEQNNPYGESKKAGEDLLRKYSEETGSEVLIYRFPNVFGKWCKPNYNSAVATFCYNIARGLPVTISNPKIEMTLVYIDDVISELKNALEGNASSENGIKIVPITHKMLLGDIVETIHQFKTSRDERSIPDMSSPIIKKLYSTYLSYLPKDTFSYPLKMNVDNRGSFTEIIRTADRGQVSVNISKPGITKGNHWHHTKNEKFVVVSGEGVIRFRSVGSNEVIEYFVSGEKVEVVDIPVGYTHNIENLGNTDMVTIMWVNEPFNPDMPDTYYLEV